MKLVQRGCHSLFVLFAIACQCWTQSGPTVSPLDGYTPGQMMQGMPAGTYQISNFESINPANGQLNVNIPLLTITGRGPVNLPVIARLTPPMWNVYAGSEISDCDPVLGCQVYWYYLISTSGWETLPGYGSGKFVFRSSGDYCRASSAGNEWDLALTRGTLLAPDGTETEFVDQKTNGAPEYGPQSGDPAFDRGTVFIADNGSMATFTSSTPVSDSTSCSVGQTTNATGTLVFRDGTKYTFNNGDLMQIEDRNGNYAAIDQSGNITDSIGRTYEVSYANGSQNYDQIQYNGANGVQRTITIRYGSLDAVLVT